MRALAAQDGASARELVRAVYERTRHLARTLELVELALPADDPEYEGLVSTAYDGSVLALLLHGSIGGAAGVIKVHALVGRSTEALIMALRALDSVRDARLLICELSNEPEQRLARRALALAGFTCEGVVADYFGDGIALDLLVLRPDPRAVSRGAL